MIEIERGYVWAVIGPLEQMIARLDEGRKLKAMTSFKLAKLVDKLGKHIQELAADNELLAKKHGGKRTEQGTWEFPSDEVRNQFEADWREITLQKVSIDIKPFSLDEFSENGHSLLTFAELRLFLPFITDAD